MNRQEQINRMIYKLESGQVKTERDTVKMAIAPEASFVVRKEGEQTMHNTEIVTLVKVNGTWKEENAPKKPHKIPIPVDNIMPYHIGSPFLYVNKGFREIGVLTKVGSVGFEFLFGMNDKPIMLGKDTSLELYLITVK